MPDLKLLHSLPVLIHKLEFMINLQLTSEHISLVYLLLFFFVVILKIVAHFHNQLINHLLELGPGPAKFYSID